MKVGRRHDQSQQKTIKLPLRVILDVVIVLKIRHNVRDQLFFKLT